MATGICRCPTWPSNNCKMQCTSQKRRESDFHYRLIGNGYAAVMSSLLLQIILGSKVVEYTMALGQVNKYICICKTTALFPIDAYSDPNYIIFYNAGCLGLLVYIHTHTQTLEEKLQSVGKFPISAKTTVDSTDQPQETPK